MAQDDLQTLLRIGIEAAQGGNAAAARAIFDQVIDQDPDNELAWIWKATVAETPQDRRASLHRALEINPRNKKVRRALAELDREAAAPRRAPRPAAASGPVSAGDDRALREAAPQPARRSILPLLLVFLLALALIAAGGVLIASSLLEDDDATPTPTSAQAAGPPATVATPASSFATPTPVGGTLRTQRPALASPAPATWTPTATWTPPPTVTATSTPPPVTSYALLAVGRASSAEPWSILRIAPDGRGEEPIEITWDGADLTLVNVAEPSLSPDGRQIAFTGRVRRDSDPPVEFHELFVVPTGGGEAQRLTTLEALTTGEPDWSPDGELIAFASDADGDYDIYTIRPDGATPRALTDNTTQDRSPAWSPDGARIALVSDRQTVGTLQVWTVDAFGGDARPLTDLSSPSLSPAWSPDGRQIVFVLARQDGADLQIMNADSTNRRPLTDRDGWQDDDPAWSPDGAWIAFSAYDNSGIYSLFAIRPDGTARQAIEDSLTDRRYPVWIP